MTFGLSLLLFDECDDDDGAVPWPGAVGGAVAGRRDGWTDGWINIPLAPAASIVVVVVIVVVVFIVVMSSSSKGRERGLTLSIDHSHVY